MSCDSSSNASRELIRWRARNANAVAGPVANGRVSGLPDSCIARHQRIVYPMLAAVYHGTVTTLWKVSRRVLPNFRRLLRRPFTARMVIQDSVYIGWYHVEYIVTWRIHFREFEESNASPYPNC
jgi:hypothetical protein